MCIRDSAQCEQDCDDDAESIITGERYGVIAHIIDECLTKAPAKMSTSEKIDRVVTNRILGLPIFVVIMFCVYYIAVSTLGGTVTDFTNDQLFGTDGWYAVSYTHLDVYKRQDYARYGGRGRFPRRVYAQRWREHGG